MEWSNMARQVFQERYSMRDEVTGIPHETPEQIIERVARWTANDEEQYTEFMYVLENKLFLPNTPTWINAGNPRSGTKSACFTFNVEDSVHSIFDVMGTKAAIVMQQGGGVGFDLSNIRPKGDMVKSSGKVATGVVDFMRVINNTADVISQGGKRRSAVMCMLDISHPEVLDFIKCKDGENHPLKKTLDKIKHSYFASDRDQVILELQSEIDLLLRHMNISVRIPDEFYHAVEANDMWEFINPRNGVVADSMRARDLWDMVCIAAHKKGDPGIINDTRIQEGNPTPYLGRLNIVNPCAEYPGYDNESCTLGSINLALMVKHGEWDIKKLESVTRIAVQFLDNVITKNDFPYPEIEEATLRTRKIGIGVMGFATAMLKMETRYGSDASIRLAGVAMKHIKEVSHVESARLATEIAPFPAFNDAKDLFFKRRNATLTTIAPTGTISKVAQVSGGIEPIYNFVVEYHILGGKKIIDYDPEFLEICRKYNIPEKEITKALEDQSIQGADFPLFLKEFLVTAKDVNKEEELAVHQAFQKFTDNAVSKTYNLPANSTWKDVHKIYWSAWEMGLKGLTVFVDQSRSDQVLNTPKWKDVKIPTNIKIGGNWTTELEDVIKKSYHSIPELHGASINGDISHCANGRCNI